MTAHPLPNHRLSTLPARNAGSEEKPGKGDSFFARKTPTKATIGTPKRERTLQAVQEDAPSCLNVFRRAFGGKSLRASVDAKCLECTWLDRAAIRECAATECPIHSVRPYQSRRGGVL